MMPERGTAIIQGFGAGALAWASLTSATPAWARQDLPETQSGGTRASAMPTARYEAVANIHLRGQAILAKDLTVLDDNQQHWLPLSTLFTLLGFNVEKANNREISGTFLVAGQTFRISIESRSVEIADRFREASEDDLLLVDGEIYGSTSALRRWFRLESQWHPKRLILDFDPPYALPKEAAMLRAQHGASINRRRNAKPDTSGFRPIVPGYRLLGWPDVTINATVNRGRAGSRGSDGQLSLFAQTDVLAMHGKLAISSRLDGQFTGRLTLGRSNDEGGLLGPLDASHFSFGDISGAARPLISRSASGIGIQFGNRAASYQNVDDGELIGDAPPGWQAELRRGGAIIAFTIVGQDGRYHFKAPLGVGANQFTIHLFGPDGQEQVLERVVDNRPQAASTGRLRYDVSLVREDSEFLRPILGQKVVTDGVNGGSDWQNGGRGTTASLALDYGLAKGATLQSIGAIHWDDDQVQAFVGLGVHARLGRLDGDGLLVLSNDGALAGRASARGRIGTVGWRLATEQFGDEFQSDYLTQSSNRIERRDTFALDWRLSRWSLGVLGTRSSYDNAGDSWSTAMRASGSLRQVAISQTIRLSNFAGSTRVNGSSILRARLGNIQVRGGANYDLREGTLRMQRASLQAATRIAGQYVRAEVERDFSLKDQRFRFSTSHDFQGIRLGSMIEHSKRAGLYTGLTLGLSLGRDPLSGSILFGNAARRGEGLVRARYFHDQNADRQRNPNEPFVKGARLMPIRGGAALRNSGIETILRLPSHRAVGLSTDLSNVIDPFLQPVEPGYLVYPRPGSVIDLDIPLQTTSQITVRVTTYREGNVGQIPVVIEGCEGRTRSVSMTFEDGLAYFDQVPLGCQKVSLPDGSQKEVLVDSDENSIVEFHLGAK
jgi:hypothetical protein